MKVLFVHIDGEGEYARWGDSLARLMVASVKKHMNCPVVHVRDLMTEPIAGCVDVPVAWESDYLMPFRLHALRLARPGEEVLMLDTDILLTESVASVFDDKDFDVAMCRRDNLQVKLEGEPMPDMPYNTGFIASRCPQFFIDALRVCEGYPAKWKSWFGDQLAVAEVAAGGRYRVKDLARTWNHPVQAPQDYGAKVLHYKGPKRKAWMAAAAKDMGLA